MSTFYGQVSGQAQTVATRRGSRNSGLTVSAQSWDGSVITDLSYNDKDDLIVTIKISDGSSSFGGTYFCGTLDELKEKLLAPLPSKGGEE